MNRRAQAIEHLERSGEDSRRRRALAARLDTALKRAGISTARLARRLNVGLHDVQLWRRGITVPPVNVFPKIAVFLDVDAFWLCTGRTAGALAI
ncbi:MAG TPA: helix-turn-helix transcriptional regulator [Paraburkholderia sp.]|uniref:helix-turn-helix domain-containing protein n=1 Tax=Paraburkholderia sp. TaxID=1926495 RepID=UPI002B494F91|nr:helix-turn-helix transcriptional regulator [Paraburkholderia sp.]HKR39392.1 helix-turn-helix transcriptional regulator [Paraburkholderia sp.]